MIEGFEAIGFHVPSLIAYAANFAVLLGLLYLLAYRPLLRSVRDREERRRAADAMLDDAKRVVDEAEAEAEATLSHARAEAHRIVSESLAKARADAQQETERRLRQADARIDAHLAGERRRIAQESAELAVAAATHVLKQALGPKTHRALIEAAIEELRRVPIKLDTAKPGLVTVTSAVELTEDEMHTVAEAIGARPAITVHQVRPDIVGGLAVSIGGTLIDASVLGQLHRLNDELSRADVG